MSDRNLSVGGPSKSQIINSDGAGRDSSEAIVGSPMLGVCRPVAAFGRVAFVVPTRQGGGHCTVGQPQLIGPPNWNDRRSGGGGGDRRRGVR